MSENFNQKKLSEITEVEVTIDDVIYIGSEKHVETLMKVAPVPQKLTLKIGCKVIFLQNDPQKRGSMALVEQ